METSKHRASLWLCLESDKEFNSEQCLRRDVSQSSGAKKCVDIRRNSEPFEPGSILQSHRTRFLRRQFRPLRCNSLPSLEQPAFRNSSDNLPNISKNVINDHCLVSPSLQPQSSARTVLDTNAVHFAWISTISQPSHVLDRKTARDSDPRFPLYRVLYDRLVKNAYAPLLGAPA